MLQYWGHAYCIMCTQKLLGNSSLDSKFGKVQQLNSTTNEKCEGVCQQGECIYLPEGKCLFQFKISNRLSIII